MRSWILSFSLGVLAGGFIPVLPPFRVTLLLWLPLLLSGWWRWLSLASAFCLGLWWLLCQAIIHHEHLLPAHLEQVDMWITGTVSGLPQAAGGSARFMFRANSLCIGDDRSSCSNVTPNTPRRFLLNDYGDNPYRSGEHLALQVRLKRPHGFANPGGFDYERWLFQAGISATGYVRETERLEQLPLSVFARFNGMRQHQQAWLDSLPLTSGGFIKALIIGDRFGITDRQWQLLTATGTNHLIVISGLHIGLVTWLAYRLLEWLLRRCPRCSLVCPASKSAVLGAIAVSLCYSALAGFSLPVQRALVMVCCLMSGLLLVRQTWPLNNLCLALLAVLLLDPLAPQSAGFWLSFTAVALLLTLPKPAGEMTTYGQSRLLLRTQYVLFLGLAPLMLILFRQVSLLAPLVNLVAIPFIGLLVVPLCLLALVTAWFAPVLAEYLIVLPDALLAAFESTLFALTSSVPAWRVAFPALPAWLLALLAGVIAIHLMRPRPGTWLALALAATLAHGYRGQRPAPGSFQLDILDVGQGLAVTIATRHHLLLFDTGPAYSPRFNAGEGIIVPFLAAVNLGVPDLVIISHGDNDHAGGLSALRQSWPGVTYMAGENRAWAQGQSQSCRAGQAWQWDGVHFRILSPDETGREGNDASCVLQVSAGNFTALLPGDIEAKTELALVRRYRESLAASILLAPHHGSKTSSTPVFIRFTDPQHVIFSSGYLNRFNHPDPAVVARYHRHGSTLHHSALSGHLRVLVNPESGPGDVLSYRETRPIFWSGRP